MRKIITRFFFATLFLCFVFLPSAAVQAEPFETVMNNGSPQNRVDIAILGDGYTAAQLQQYRNDVQRFIDGVFLQEPYKEYRRYFNVHRIDVTSNQSGADHPERNPQVFVDTALDATYNCSNIQRLICISTIKANQVIARSLPASHFEIILVIVNDQEYGGSGGSVAVTSLNTGSFIELILHEVGHSFGLLADEYTGGGPSCNPNIEPPEANATRETQRQLIKWNLWVDPLTPIPTTSVTAGIPGLYQGSKYCDNGLYRPTYDNKMRSLGFPFEQINTEQHVKRIYSFVSPIDASTPAETTISVTTNQTRTFTITPQLPATHSLTVNWLVDGQQVANGNSFNLQGATLGIGQHTVQAVITDSTSFVRNDPQQVLRRSKSWTVNVLQGTQSRPRFDFDGDGKADEAVYRPATGSWYVNRSSQGFFGMQFGIAADKIVPADYDGDGKTDIAVYRDGFWYLMRSSQGFTSVQFGAATDLPRPADFDGDGKADINVYRPSNGAWYRLNSSNGAFVAENFGAAEDKPVPADFDGDGKADITVYRPSNGAWYRLNSTNGAFVAENFGAAEDKPVPADFDGDGKADITVYRPSAGSWYRLNSTNGAFNATLFGVAEDLPVAADYDGDGKADIAVYRPSTGNWYRLNSTNGAFNAILFGIATDKPIPAFTVQ